MDNVITTPVDATITHYDPVAKNVELQDKIVDLEKRLDTANSNWEFSRTRIMEYAAKVEHLESFIKENHSYMDEDHVTAICEIFDIVLSQDYDVTVTVSFSGTVTVPLGYDMDNLENDLRAELSASYGADVEADLYEDSMDIDYSEA